MIMKKLAGVFAVLYLGFAVSVQAHDDQDMKMPMPSAEFQQMKQLVGSWKGTTTPMGKDKKSETVLIDFKLTAAGSAIEETLLRGTPHEMVDMYHDEGGKLVMTHYC